MHPRGTWYVGVINDNIHRHISFIKHACQFFGKKVSKDICESFIEAKVRRMLNKDAFLCVVI